MVAVLRRKAFFGVLALILLAVVAFVLWQRGETASDSASAQTEIAGADQARRPTKAMIATVEAGEAPAVEASEGDDAEAPTAAATDAEKAEEEAERRVDAFDALTDKWMEPSTDGVTMADVDAFVRQFSSVPKDRKEECLQRALNLIPDQNVMLLAGVLMDKTQDKALVELVFNDVLNRDEDVKKPIMQQIFKDKSHPCWADVAWILDVTGEKKE